MKDSVVLKGGVGETSGVRYNRAVGAYIFKLLSVPQNRHP
jgi:hypothetical protein